MSRPRKPINYEQELEKVDAQIARCDSTRAELIKRRQELLNEKRESEVGMLYDALQEKGISIEDIMEIITNSSSVQKD